MELITFLWIFLGMGILQFLLLFVAVRGIFILLQDIRTAVNTSAMWQREIAGSTLDENDEEF